MSNKSATVTATATQPMSDAERLADCQARLVAAGRALAHLATILSGLAALAVEAGGECLAGLVSTVPTPAGEPVEC